MAFGTKYQWEIKGRERTWLIELQQEGFSEPETTLQGHRTARIIWGETTGDLDARIMPADMRLQVLDPDYTLFNELSAAGVEEDDYRIVLTESTGTYTMRFRVRLDTVKTLLFPNTEVPVVELYAFCGLSNLKTIDAVTLSSASAHEIARYLLVSSTIAQDIEYVTGAYPSNIHSSGPVLDLWRLNRLDLTYEEEGRKRDNAESQLRGILEALDAALWNGMDGQWHLKHRFTLGEYITGRGPQRYIHASTSLVALSTLQLPIFQAVARNMSRGTTRRLDQPIQAVEIEQGPDAQDRFMTANLVRYGDFEEGWVSSTEHIMWEGSSSVVERSTDSDAGTYALQINAVSPATVRQNLGYFSGNQPIRFHIVGRFGHELTSGGSGGSVSHTLRLVLDPYDAAESAYYATTTGWTTTPGGFTLTDTANPFGSGVSYQDIDIELIDNLPPLDGLLYIEFVGDTTGNFVVRLDNIEVRIVTEGYEVQPQFKAVFHRLQNNTNPAQKGPVVRQRRPWFPGNLGLDTDNNTIRDLIAPMIQADIDGAGDWQEAGYWTSEIEGDISEYDDLARWSAESRIEQQQDPLEVIEGEVMGILTPEMAVRYNNASHIPLYCELDLATEVTRFAAAKKQRVYASDSPFAPTGTIFFTTGTSSNSEITANSVCRRNTDGSVTAIHTFVGTEPSVLCLDEIERWIFVVQGLKIWRMRYDGSDVSEIYEESGFTSIGGIVFVPGGTYEGQIVYTALTTPVGTDDDVYRMLRDGTGRTKISNNQYLSNDGGIVLRSNTEAWLSAGFSGRSIISYGLAGTIYGDVQTQQTFNNQIGIAYDPAGNRVWTQSNGDIRQTNTSGDNYTTVGSITNGTSAWWDATGSRLFYGGTGLRYRAGGAIGTELLLSPLVVVGGAYDVNQTVVIQ